MTREELIKQAAREYAEHQSFRVPYDGSNNFYNDEDYNLAYESFIAGAEWVDKYQALREVE